MQWWEDGTQVTAKGENIMSVTAVMVDLATNPIKLEEFRADPDKSLALFGLEGTGAAAVSSRDPGQVRKAIAGETGVVQEMAAMRRVVSF
jgi:hypothetical protein